MSPAPQFTAFAYSRQYHFHGRRRYLECYSWLVMKVQPSACRRSKLDIHNAGYHEVAALTSFFPSSQSTTPSLYGVLRIKEVPRACGYSAYR
jgi:hypothetical protein